MKTKQQLIERWDRILHEAIGSLPLLIKKYYDIIENDEGDYTDTLMRKYDLLARLGYLLNNNVTDFKTNLQKSISFAIELFERFEYGDPIHPLLFSMVRYRQLLDALASGDIAIAKQLAKHMGGRQEIEEAKDDDFVLSLGYGLKFLVEGEKEKAKKWVTILKQVCENEDNQMQEFLGYPLVLESILENDLHKANEAFKVLVAGHKKKCSKRKGPDYGPYFHDTPDADLFVWGIGLANLCRCYGLNVVVNDPIIPEELIIPVAQ